MGRDRMIAEQAGVTGKLKSKLGKKMFYVLSLTGITAIGGWIMKKYKPKWYKAVVDKLPNFWPFSYLKDGKEKKKKSKKKGDKTGSKEKSSDEKGSSSSDSATGGAGSARPRDAPSGGGSGMLSDEDALRLSQVDPHKFRQYEEAGKISDDVLDRVYEE